MSRYNQILRGAAAVWLALLSPHSASSTPLPPDPSPSHYLTGTIAFEGTAVLDSPSAGLATGVTSWGGLGGLTAPSVARVSGDFVNFFGAGTLASFDTAWQFNTSSSVMNLWSVSGFTFTLQASTVARQVSGTHSSGGEVEFDGIVEVLGSGWVSGNGLLSTFGTWNFVQNDLDRDGAAKFWFVAMPGGPTAVPETGSTALLLGSAVVALMIGRRIFPRARLSLECSK